jgi:hypothetical protein
MGAAMVMAEVAVVLAGPEVGRGGGDWGFGLAERGERTPAAGPAVAGVFIVAGIAVAAGGEVAAVVVFVVAMVAVAVVIAAAAAVVIVAVALALALALVVVAVAVAVAIVFGAVGYRVVDVANDDAVNGNGLVRLVVLRVWVWVDSSDALLDGAPKVLGSSLISGGPEICRVFSRGGVARAKPFRCGGDEGLRLRLDCRGQLRRASKD